MEMEKKFFPSVDQQVKEDKSLGSEPRERVKDFSLKEYS